MPGKEGKTKQQHMMKKIKAMNLIAMAKIKVKTLLMTQKMMNMNTRNCFQMYKSLKYYV